MLPVCSPTPQPTRNLIFFFVSLFQQLSSGVVKRVGPAPTIYKKPPPLSAHIRQATYNIKSRATSLECQMSTPPQSTDPFTPFKTAVQRRQAYKQSDLDSYEVLFTPRKKESRWGCRKKCSCTFRFKCLVNVYLYSILFSKTHTKNCSQFPWVLSVHSHSQATCNYRVCPILWITNYFVF